MKAKVFGGVEVDMPNRYFQLVSGLLKEDDLLWNPDTQMWETVPKKYLDGTQFASSFRGVLRKKSSKEIQNAIELLLKEHKAGHLTAEDYHNLKTITRNRK